MLRARKRWRRMIGGVTWELTWDAPFTANGRGSIAANARGECGHGLSLPGRIRVAVEAGSPHHLGSRILPWNNFGIRRPRREGLLNTPSHRPPSTPHKRARTWTSHLE